MGVVLGGLAVSSTPPVYWTGVAMKWIGWDGTEWMLSDESDGTVMMPGVRGMNMPPIIHHRAAHASVPGARWRGMTVDVREVFWPLQVYSDDGSQAWVEKDRAFWRTMDPSKVGTWIVYHPNGQQRQLQVRFLDDGQHVFGHDPHKDGWDTYGITLAAEQPYWEGPAVKREWHAGAPVDFFGSPGGPAFTISPGNTIGQATFENPGDVAAWPVWRVHGPVDSATVGVNGRLITLPFAIAAGQVVEIDTRPSAQTAMKGPVAGPLTSDWTYKLGDIDFAPLPEREESTLSLSIEGTGGGWVSASFTPLYYRAW